VKHETKKELGQFICGLSEVPIRHYTRASSTFQFFPKMRETYEVIESKASLMLHFVDFHAQ